MTKVRSSLTSALAVIGMAALVAPVLLTGAGGSAVAAAGAAPGKQPAPTTAGVDGWGDNSAGQIGDDTLTASGVPVATQLSAAGAATVTAVAAGARHDLALLSNGQVLAWGDDTDGELGNGSTSANGSEEVPTLVTGLSGVIAVAAGGEHSLALLGNGTVDAWGANNDGQLGTGSTVGSNVPVAVPGLSGVTAIAAGDQFSLALLGNGTVEAWGNNEEGQLGIGSLANTETPTPVSGLSGVRSVSAGGQHALALLTNGTVMSWGDNEVDQLGDGSDTQSLSTVPVAVTGLAHAIQVSAGYEHSVALRANGTVVAWGDNGFYQLARRQGFPGGHSRSDKPLKVPGVSGATAISAGGLFTLALLGSGSVVGWGDDSYGQLGNSSDQTVQQVAAVQGLTDVTAIAAGGVGALAIVGTQAAATASTAGVAPEAGAASPSSSPWQVQATQDPSGHMPVDSFLSSVSAASTQDAWAVSPETSDGNPIGEHWNGSTWALSPLVPGTSSSSTITGVDDLSPTNAWAVGESPATTSNGRTLIEHWNGKAWGVVPSPDPNVTAGASDDLVAVGGTDPDDLWAVGSFTVGPDAVALLLAHYDGTSWTASTPPSVVGVQFGRAVTVVSATDVWVAADTAGGTVTAHFNGTKWRLVPTPGLGAGSDTNTLTGITNAGSNDVWASAYEEDDAVNVATAYLLHWNGTAWSLVTVPSPGSEGSRLLGIVALSATDLWTVGATYQDDGSESALTEHSDGSAWTTVPALDPGQLAALPSNTLEGIAGEGGNDLLIVGSQSSPARCCSLSLAEGTTDG